MTENVVSNLEKLVIDESIKDFNVEPEGDKENEYTKNENNGSTVCSFCNKPDPTKRCSKRHPKCLKRVFCNESCEMLSHKKKDDCKKETKKKEDAKKKKPKAGKNPEHAWRSENRV